MRFCRTITAVLLLAAVFLLGGCGLMQSAIESMVNELSPTGQQEEATALPSAPPPGESASPQPENTSGTEEEEAFVRRTVPFDEMKYVRPDAQEDSAQINEIAARVSSAADLAEVESLTDEADAIYSNFQTMYVLAMLHSTQDKSDAYWTEEEAYLSGGASSLQLAYQNLYQALHASGFKDDIEQEWDESFFEGFDDIDFMTETTSDYSSELYQLQSKYIERLSTDTIQYNGSSLTYTDISSLSGNDLSQALSTWYSTYTQEYGEMYIELVRLRQKIAAEQGYDNYIEYYYSNHEYSSGDVLSLLADIKEHIVPVYKQCIDLGFHYNPDVSMDFDDFKQFFRDVTYKLSPSFTEAMDYMEENGLYDYEQRQYKEQGAYTTYIEDYDAPFMMGTYTGDLNSMTTFAHEFGHFTDYYHSEGLFGYSLDSMETFSQALELMFSNYFSSKFDAYTAYQMQYDTIAYQFYTIPSQAYYTAFEMQVYGMDPDELTVEKIRAIAEEEAANFGLDMLNDKSYYANNWVTVSHIVSSTFYTITYTTASDAALQIWLMSREDEQKAVDTYFDLIENAYDYSYLENLERAGLQSPFAAGRAETLARFAEDYLVKENWLADAV